ncbi:MAG: AAA family ATPase, partial [Acidobacteria bacterium]|nr:AAA family ATPase [Acidobacteriota bacterium]
LDPLTDRDVVLWPDNDEPGVGLMERLARLLPGVRLIRPVVPEKGDAYDYFEGGGTVDALRDLIHEGEPQALPIGDDAVRVTYPTPAGVITFEFTELSIGRSRTTDSTLLVRVERRPDEYSTRVNLLSSSGRDNVRKDVEKQYKSLGLADWTTVINTVATMADRTFKRIDSSIDLADVEPATERKWAVERFAPAGSVTVLFGMGGSGKSQLSADLMLHALYGEPWLGRAVVPVLGALVVDYEDQPDEWRLRCEQICRAHGWKMPGGFRYMPGRTVPLADQAQTVEALIERYGIGLIVVDSAASAVGGELKEPMATARLINFLASMGQRHGCSTLLIAHNTKADDKAATMFPYGDVFWHNLPRATHYVHATQQDGSPTMQIDLWNRKGNRGKQKPIPVRIDFPETDEGPVAIVLDNHRTPQEIADVSATTDGSIKWRIAARLDEGPGTISEIATSTGIARDSVEKTLKRGDGELFTRIPNEYPQRWARKSDRDEAFS